MRFPVLFFAISLLLFPFTACNNDDDGISCPQSAILDTALFNSTPSASDIQTIEAFIESSCLTITVTGLWCDDPSRDAELIGIAQTSQDSDGIPIRVCALFLEPADDCGQSITRTFSFNIEPFRVAGATQIRIALQDASTYTYLY